MDEKRGGYLQREFSLAFLESASRDRTTSPFSQTPNFDDLLLLTCSLPPVVIQILHIKIPSLFQAQLFKIRQDMIAAFPLHLRGP